MRNTAAASSEAPAAPEAARAGDALAAALAEMGQGYCHFDAAFRLVDWNDPFPALLRLPDGFVRRGLTFEELLRHRAERGDYDPLDREATVANRLTLMRRGRTLKVEHVLPGGAIVESRSAPVAGGGFVTIHTDVTGRRRAEMERQSAEEQTAAAQRALSDAIKALGEGFAFYDADDRLVVCNQQFRRLLHPAADMLVPGTHYSDILDRLIERGAVTDSSVPAEQWRRDRLERRHREVNSFQYKTRDDRWIRGIDRPISDGGVVSIRIDITSLKERERALTESRERAATAERALSDAIESLPEGFTIYDADDRIVACNSAMRTLLPDHAHLHRPGVRYEAILDALLAQGALQEAVGREEAYKAERLAHRRAGGGTFEYQLEDGRWVRAIDHPTSDGGVVSIRIDITSLKERERELSEKSGLLEATLASMAQGVIMTDADLRIRAINDQALSLLGLAPEVGYIGAHVADVFRCQAARGDFGDVDVEAEVAERLATFCRPVNKIVERSRGGSAWLEIRRNPMPDGGWVTTLTDVTESRQAEGRLRASEVRYRRLLESAPVAILVHDEERVLYANPAGAALLRAADPAELTDRRLEDLTDPDWFGRIRGLIARVLRGEIAPGPGPGRFRALDGTVIDIEITCHSFELDGQPAIQSIIRDVTESKRAEEALRRSEAEAAAARQTLIEAIDSLSEGFALFDADDRLVICNEPYRACYPITAPKMQPGVTFDELIRYGVAHGEYADVSGREADWIETRVHRHRNPGGAPFEQKFPDGRWLRVVENRTPSGGVAGLRVDITDQKRAEEALRESEERHRGLIEQLPDAVIVHDGHDLHYGNPAAVAMLGAESDEDLRRHTLEDITPAEAWPEVKRYVEEGLARGESSPLIPAVMIRLDGRPIDVELVGQPFDHRGRRLAQIVARDVTEQKRAEAEHRRLEEELRQAQKMEAIGTLAGGIAHDFNNVLGAMLGYAELTRDDVPPDSPASDNLSQIIGAGRRAQDLVAQILAFSRREQTEIGPVRLANVVEEVMGLLQPSIPKSIDIATRIEAADAVVEGRAGQIHQVLMNLCANAAQAMGARPGRLAVTLASHRQDRTEETATGALYPGDYAVLEVADTGDGIAPEVAARMFEPFFTTKGVGEGTGMGLAVVHGIVGDHGGRIAVDSAPGKGTTIRVYLPRGASGAAAEEEAPARPSSGAGRVLVIDDESMIAEMIGRMLARLGYQPECVTSALEAMAIMRQRIHDFDLILTDQTMPNATGDMIIEEAHRLAPGLPVILCSGYGPALTTRAAAEIGARAFLSKPFKPAELGEAVRRAMAANEKGDRA